MTAFGGGSGYRVVARRYRPQRFDELVGQEHVARGLSGAISSGRVGHAYLFTGARGVGKTSAARIFAKALECVSGPAAEPCNQCENCDAIAAGQDVDVVEIDAASNRGIDEIRSLRQNVAVRPARGRFKIYIIDEVHMLTREAFNALLKTLEEPPGHVKFVLCTTEPEKLPITILSRCQRFDFVTVDAPAIARRLEQIVAAEGASVDADAVRLISRRAAGSMRDSQSLLEQLLGTGAVVGVNDVHAVIGTGREERVGALIAAIASRDSAAALAALDGALAGGADPGGVLEQVLAALRDCLVASVGCGPEALLQGDSLGIDLAAVGRELGTETVLAMLQIIDHSLSRMRTSGHAGVLAEMAVVRISRLEDLDNLAAAVERIAEAASQSPTPSPVRARAVSEMSRPQPLPASGASSARIAAAPLAEREKKTTHLNDPVVQPLAEVAETEPVSPRPLPTIASDPLAAWRQSGQAVGGLAADFVDTAIRAVWQGDLLEVVIPADATTAASFLRRAEMHSALNRALSAAAGRPLGHTIIQETTAPLPATALGGGRPATHAPTGGGKAEGAQVFVAPVRSQAALLRETMEYPLVVHAMGLFDAAVRKVEPPRPRAPVVAAVGTPPGDTAGEVEGGQGGGADSSAEPVTEAVADRD